MSKTDTGMVCLTMVKPNPERDAPFALEWLSAPQGKETLLSMGNPEHAIKPATLGGEKERLDSFLKLEASGKQLTWMMRMDEKTIGAAWIALEKHGTVKAPSIHLMIGDASYRGKGIGAAAIAFMIAYARDVLKADVVYSRNLVSNERIARLKTKVGFIKDGAPYSDEDGLIWQNTKMSL